MLTCEPTGRGSARWLDFPARKSQTDDRRPTTWRKRRSAELPPAADHSERLAGARPTACAGSRLGRPAASASLWERGKAENSRKTTSTCCARARTIAHAPVSADAYLALAIVAPGRSHLCERTTGEPRLGAEPEYHFSLCPSSCSDELSPSWRPKWRRSSAAPNGRALTQATL